MHSSVPPAAASRPRQARRAPRRRARFGVAAALAAALVCAAVPHAPAAAEAGDGPPWRRGGERVRVVSWNIFHGGRDAALGGRKNLALLLDQVVALAPDVFFAVETYGSARAIRTALTERAGRGAYHAVQVTRGPRGQGKDNLWIFTRYRVTETFPRPRGGTVTDFNVGGARVELPGGQRVNLVDTWIDFSRPWIGHLVNANVKAARKGERPPHPPARVAAAERRTQARMLRDIVRTQLPALLGDDRSPVLLAGDLNTVPASDWSQRWAHCAGHHGLAYGLRATDLLASAGFRDTYREANPDVCAAPGGTWNPLRHGARGPLDRIDYIFARGARLHTVRSFTVGSRLPQHEPGPFYSDHSAVVTDLTVG
ncbi:endonuclease/exonuclease/phosphatase family protein [Streptomyces boncukensis]|uniref:Endonuclease/exonuclease/phosphatase family protein n=1 Tax=Streptomyces boncukensis TaxID=2711219 RepID=A0A6G4X373_9ACTN|nr:endonuclease/exonuclease/phosphatase family protein [Streptomyces boncukensis]NGO71582.1 endonuclease/exonuclease/phosphatase family protein [Streptomyces boncukensis]